jgi:hypothetical protein
MAPGFVRALVFGLLCPRNLEGTPGTMPDRSVADKSLRPPFSGAGRRAGRWVFTVLNMGAEHPCAKRRGAVTVGWCSPP